MKIIAIYGSPNKEGNSASLVNAILNGAAENGHSITRFYLHELGMGNCLDCKDARKNHLERYCIHDDRMTKEVIPDLIQADIVVISSPVYMGHITGITKTFFDRWHTFLEEDFKVRYLPGKRFITVITSGAPQETFKNVSEYLDKWLSSFFKMEKIEQLHIGGLMGTGEINNKKELLDNAFKIGKSIN